MKKIKKNVKTIIIIVIIIMTVFSIFIINKNSMQDSIKFKKEYEALNKKNNCDNKTCPTITINKNNKIKYTTSNEIKNIIDNKDSATVYIGKPNCAYCRSAVEVLVEAANESEIDEILYYINDENSKDYNLLKDNIDNIFKENNKIKEPIVLFILDGKIVSYKIGTIYSHKNPHEKMDKSGQEGLKDIYKYGIDLVVQAKKIKAKVGK